MTAQEAVQKFIELQANVRDAHSACSRPGKRLSKAERDARMDTYVEADLALDAFMARLGVEWR